MVVFVCIGYNGVLLFGGFYCYLFMLVMIVFVFVFVFDSFDVIVSDIVVNIVVQCLLFGVKLFEEVLVWVYQVSCIKICVVLVMLVKDKLVDLIFDKGVFVSKFMVEEMCNLFFVCWVLEVVMVCQFVVCVIEVDYVWLEVYLEQECQVVKDDNMQVCFFLLSDFYILLVCIVGNDVLIDILEKLVGCSVFIIMFYQFMCDVVCFSEEYGVFIVVVWVGDVEKVVELMEYYLLYVEQVLVFEFKFGLCKDLLCELLL